MIGLAYLTGRAFGAALAPLAPVLDALLEGLLDSVFGEPDEMDDFEPIAAPERPRRFERVPVPPLDDVVWTLERDRIDEIRGAA